MKRIILILIAASALLVADDCKDAFTELQLKKPYQVKYLQNEMYEEENKIVKEMQVLAVKASIECTNEEDKNMAEKYLTALKKLVTLTEEKIAERKFNLSSGR